jgi:hypothetical protein
VGTEKYPGATWREVALIYLVMKLRFFYQTADEILIKRLSNCNLELENFSTKIVDNSVEEVDKLQKSHIKTGALSVCILNMHDS